MPRFDSTLPPSAPIVDTSTEDAEGLALVLLWSRHEPHRVGEVARVSAGGAGPRILGRGEANGDERRLTFARQRPGALEVTGPLESPRISRVQLLLAPRSPRELEVQNVGRCPMEIDGQPAVAGTLTPGSVLELKNALLLLCTIRPPRLSPLLSMSPHHPFGEADRFGLVGESPALWRLRGTLSAVARRTEHVLVTGPSGSGKELVSRALHAESARARRPLVARNASTIPESLLDAELFGNLRNYPNPGTPERPGLVGQADGSTLFLDEVAELPPSMQAHLLRVLDAGEYHRLGEPTARRSDLRLVAATNRPESALKHDLLARLQIRLVVPGLDERREDIPLLATHLLRRHAEVDEAGAARFFPTAGPRAYPSIAPALVRALVRHAYVAHMRELEALLVTATIESTGAVLELTEGVRRRLAPTAAAGAEPAEPGAEGAFTPGERRRIELLRRHRFRPAECGRDPEYHGNRQTADLHIRQLVCKALRAASWDVDAAAALLAGAHEGLRDRARERIETFLGNLERRLGGPAAEEEAHRRAVVAEWRGSADDLVPVLDALRDGLLAGRGGAGAPAGRRSEAPSPRWPERQP